MTITTCQSCTRRRTPRAAIPLAVFLAVAGALVATGTPRWAQGADNFDRHYKRGLTLYQQKDYAGAIAEMSAAYEERQLPRILLNIGQAYRKIGKAREALAFYERWLKAEPDAPPSIQTEIKQYIAQTQALLDAPIGQEAVERASEPAPVGWSRETGQILPEYAAQLREKERQRPIYKKPWFWAVIGGGVAATIAIGVGVGVAKSRELPSGIDVLSF